MAASELAQARLEISLPRFLKEYIDSLVADGYFETPSEFVELLITRDQNLRTRALDDELLRALDSEEILIAPEDMVPGRFMASLRAGLVQAKSR